MPKFYLTTPIYYVNARPHIGHTYTTVVADAIARYKRQSGYDVVFLTGTDEHGEKLARSAREAGLEPRAFVDSIAAEYRALFESLGLTFDVFLRTTERRHAAAVRKLYQAVKHAGYIYQGRYEGQYCVSCELYVTDPTPEGNCPTCGRPPERIEEENYFFKLSAFQNALLEHYEAHPEFIQPEVRRNEVVSFVRSGLRDLSISRTRFTWGIPVPDAPGHVFYVWFDALTNYITGVGYGAEGEASGDFKKYWPADLHLVGKEIVRFHAVYWPAFLMAAGLPLPKTVFAHGHWLMEQEKMSKSRGNIVRAQPIQQVVGTDGLRYFLLREMVFGQDSGFSYDGVLARYNSDLANGFGNLAARTLTMIEKYFAGEIPAAVGPAPEDEAIAALGSRAIREFRQCMEAYEFSRALEAVWALIGGVNKYLVETQPWALAEKENHRARLASVLATAAESLRVSAVLLAPILPQAAENAWKQLGLAKRAAETPLDSLTWGQLPAGRRIGKIEPLFPRLEKEAAVAEMRRREEAMTVPAPGTPGGRVTTEANNLISIEDFARVDLRVGEVKSAERVKGADKLLKLLVDIGSEVRQVIAGIAEAYAPEALVGKKVVLVVNLEPRKIRGQESNGMIVAASVGEAGRPVLVTFTEDVPVGARLK